MSHLLRSVAGITLILALALALAPGAVLAQSSPSPDDKAAVLEARMTDAARLQMVRSTFARPDRTN